MLISVHRDVLKKALDLASLPVSPNPLLPLLSHIVLVVEGGKLYVGGTNVQLTVVAHVGAASVQGPDSRVILPASKITKLLGNYVDGQVTIDANDTHVKFQCGASRTTFHATSPENFPALPEFDILHEDDWVQTPSVPFSEALNRVFPGTSSETEKPHLWSIQSVSGLYRARNGVLTCQTSGPDIGETAVPMSVVSCLGKMINATEAETVSVFTGDNALVFRVGQYTCVGRFVQTKADFPHSAVVKDMMKASMTNTHDVAVSRDDVVAGLKRVSTTVHDVVAGVDIKVGGESMTLSTKNAEKSTSQELLTLTEPVTFTAEFTVSLPSLLDTARVWPHGTMRFRLSETDEFPVLVSDDETSTSALLNQFKKGLL